MGSLKDVAAWLTERLPELVAEHEIAGAAAAVTAGGETAEAAAGVVNLRTGVPVTTDTLFQVGSITKIWTTTLIMRLVDEGLVDLDAPVTAYLPEFRTADREVSARITVRQLLTHTSGFEGDVFADTGRGDDAVARFVAEIMPTVPQTLPPGELFSYNNAGFCVLGRIVEVVRGTTWGRAVHDELAGPLGVTVATNADEAISHRAAVGHEPEGAHDGPLGVAKVWGLTASNGPAGAMLAMSPRDLLVFARMHLDGGTTSDGTRLLSAESVERMRRPEAEVPRRTARDVRLGLGWHLHDWAGAPVVGHDGNTIGQTGFLRLVPSRGVAVALLTNGGDPDKLYREVVGHALRELADVEMPKPLPRPDATGPVTDAGRYTGAYESGLVRFEVSTGDDGRLWLDTRRGKYLADLMPEIPRRELLRLNGDLFAAVLGEDPDESGTPFRFVGADAAGRAAYLHNHRANPRVG